MKTFITIFVLVLLASQVSGQRKSKNQPVVDSSKIQIDSLTRVNKTLTIQLDSVSGELAKYMSVYNTVKEKVIHYNFDPTRSAFLVDSLKASRDSLFAGMAAKSLFTVSADSIKMLLNTNSALKARVDSLKQAWEKNNNAATAEEIGQAKAINHLKQLKDLYDNKIITETEFITLKKKYLEKL